MENPYAGEWSQIERIAGQVRSAKENIERLQEQTRGLQEQARELRSEARSVPASQNEENKDNNESNQEQLKEKADAAEQQLQESREALQKAREELQEAVSSANGLAQKYINEKRQYEEKAGKTAKAGGTLGKLAGYRFGSATAAEGQRVANQTEKSYKDRVRVLSSLIKAAGQAANGVDPEQDSSSIADKGVFHKPGSKSGLGKISASTTNANSIKTDKGGKKDRNSTFGSMRRSVMGSKKAGYYIDSETERKLEKSGHISPENLGSYKQDWNRGDIVSKYPEFEKYTFRQVVNPGPLKHFKLKNGKVVDVSKNFYNGCYNEKVLQEDLILYRGGSGDGRGHWFTFEPPDSVIQARLDNAIPIIWTDSERNFNGFSKIDTLYAFIIPKGTRIYTGPVEDQAGLSAGGIDRIQVFVPDIEKISLKDTYALDFIPGERTILTDVSERGVRLVPRDGNLVPDYLEVKDTQKITLDDRLDPTALRPETLYSYNNNKYLTDKKGNLAFVDMHLSHVDDTKSIRKNHSEYKKTGGKNAVHSDMDAGHIMSIQNGQHPSFTMEQDKTTNRYGAYKKMEQYFNSLIREGNDVHVIGVFTESNDSSGTYSPFWEFHVEVNGKPFGEYIFTNDSTQS